ncbi:MAG: PAS domain-containing protein [Proteobacteria bacterium]|nr:PAS domain-containing protein [Pseudomonadota bacterium]
MNEEDDVAERGQGLSRADLEWVLQGAQVGVWTWQIARDELLWSSELGRIFGLSEDRYPRTLSEFQELVHPGDRQALAQRMRQALAQREPHYVMEHRVVRPDGAVRWIRGGGRLELDARGAPVRLGGAAIDITEHKEAEAALRAREDELRLFSELASDYVYVADVTGAPLAPTIVAGSFSRVTGYTPQQIADRGGWFHIMHPDDRGDYDELFGELKKGIPFVSEYRIHTADGGIRWLRDHVRPVLKGGVLVQIVGGVQDITERKELEQRLQHAQRLEALARMAGGVAHDFNNIVFVITGSLALMRKEVNDRPEALEYLSDIQAACERATDLTRSLLAFGRKHVAAPKVLSLPRLVLNTRSMLQRAAGERVELQIDIEPGCGLVELDKSLFQLVLLNLTVNARAAMPRGGRLCIRVRPGTNCNGELPEIQAQRTAVVEVSDTGEGIAPEVLPRIFEPFFTTRPSGAGTGLGLATSHGIVAEAGGTMRARTKVGEGSTFFIHLPAVEAPPAHVQGTRTHVTMGGTERILVVEDDASVRSVTVRMLEAHGYSVVATQSLQQARAAVETETFELLLSDVRLPDGNGVALAKLLRKRNPKLPVLLISGYVDDESRKLLEPSDFTLLAKPLSADALARAVRRALDPVA